MRCINIKGKCILLVALFLLLSSSTVLAHSDVVIDLDYLDTVPYATPLINANVTNISTTGNFSDVTVMANNYTYATLLSVISNTIPVIDFTFDNGTKVYKYLIENETDSFNLTVYVNYSSVAVPFHPLQIEINKLELEIQNLTAKIQELNETIFLLQNNFTYVNHSMTNLTKERDDAVYNLTLKEQEYTSLLLEYTLLESDYDVLESEKETLQVKHDSIKNQADDLENLTDQQVLIIDGKNTVIDGLHNMSEQLQNTFCFSFTDEDGNWHIYFNLFWFLIGGIVVTAIVLFFFGRSKFGNGNTITSVGKKFHLPFLSKGERPTPVQWETIENSDKRSDIEQEMLNTVDEDGNVVTEDSNEPAGKTSETTADESKQKEKVNYWDTPAGKKRREELRRAGKGE